MARDLDGPRRVGLNLLYLVPGETGGRETYALRLLPVLARERPDLELTAFVNEAAADTLADGRLDGGIEVVSVRSGGGGRFGTVAAEQLALPRLVRRHGIDLLHSLGTTAPARPAAVSVVTVHDVIYTRYPRAHSRLMRAGMRVLVPLAVRNAQRLIAISDSESHEIEARLGVSRARIDVVRLAGLDPGHATDETELRERLGLGSAPIVLSVSARRPHKNISRLLEAFAGVEAPDPPLLVLPGYATGLERGLAGEARRLGIAERVRILGWVSDRDLEGLYAAAACFVFPSLAEGFGLPVLEALQRGVPVACSNVSAMPEVAGDAAFYFDPLDVSQIRDAIERLMSDEALAQRLAVAGPERARSFSWERTARQTVAVYERAWNEARGGRASSVR